SMAGVRRADARGWAAMRARTSASHACGSTPLSLQVPISEAMTAQLLAPRSGPANNHDFLPSANCRSVGSFPVLFVRHLLQPVDRLALLRLLDGDMRHGGRGRGAVPVLLARREPDDVARADLLDRAAPALGAAEPRRHDQRLAERVGVPGGARAWLEGDARALH